MAQTKKLARFEAVPSDDGATLTIETEDGVSFEQLEIMADTLDDILTENDDATEVKDAQEA